MSVHELLVDVALGGTLVLVPLLLVVALFDWLWHR